MNPLNSYKRFGDVQVDENVYIIDPKDHSIKECKVKTSKLHPKTSTRKVWVLEVYMPFRIDNIKVGLLKEAEKFGTKTTYQFIVNKDDYITLLASIVPTVMATKKNYLEQWMQRKSSGLILPSRRS